MLQVAIRERKKKTRTPEWLLCMSSLELVLAEEGIEEAPCGGAGARCTRARFSRELKRLRRSSQRKAREWSPIAVSHDPPGDSGMLP